MAVDVLFRGDGFGYYVRLELEFSGRLRLPERDVIQAVEGIHLASDPSPTQLLEVLNGEQVTVTMLRRGKSLHKTYRLQ